MTPIAQVIPFDSPSPNYQRGRKAAQARVMTHLEGMQLVQLAKVAVGVDVAKAEGLVEWYGGGMAFMTLLRVSPRSGNSCIPSSRSS